MKITTKKPLRPRGRSDEKRQSTKDAIREVYANGPQCEVQIILAIIRQQKKRRGGGGDWYLLSYGPIARQETRIQKET